MNLSGKRIWLTGASSGIGAALAIALAKRGAVLALTSRKAETLERVAAEARHFSQSVRVFTADVTDREQLFETARRIQSELGGIDIVIANAGTHIESWPERFDSREYLGLMQTNYGGMLHAIEAALPALRAQSSGRVVAVASLAGYRGLPRAAAYGASKAAMIHFLESARFHLRKEGVNVTIVNPGFVATPLTAKNNFHMPFLISAERAARHICDGLEREKNLITFPFIFAAFLAFARIIPFSIYDFFVDRIWTRMERARRSP